MNSKNINNPITSFRGKYAFLSNFYEAPVRYNGLSFRNNEAAFQAMKNPKEAYRFTGLKAKEAKALGRKVQLRSDWEDAKVRIMYEICLAKFSQHPELKERLLATGNSFLEEGNDWGDIEWGVCNGYGKNRLGKILMLVRMDLQPDNIARSE